MKALPLFAVASALAYFNMAFADGEQKFVDLGDLPLVLGATLQSCRVGYRTFGTLNSRKDNAVLVPTWYLGTSGDLAGSFGKGGLVDSSKYYVIAVDALGNGVSTSPSTSRRQHDAAFPAITIRDMVESQYRMLLKLGITHLRGVVGISMGGMQTFQWVAAYPEFMDCAVPIVGSPRPTSYDLMFYGMGIKALKEAEASKSARAALVRAFADPFWLALHTPSYYVQHTRRDEAMNSLIGFENNLLHWDTYDMSCDLDAIFHNDIFAAFANDEDRTAAAIRTKLLVISAQQDHCVNPRPALDLAAKLKAPTIVLPDNDGHQSPGVEMGRISPAIDRLLSGGD